MTLSEEQILSRRKKKATYRLKHREHINALQRKYYAEKIKNPAFKERHKQRTREWRGKNPEKSYLIGVKSHYKHYIEQLGVSFEEYREMLKHPCEICNQMKKKMDLDHNHSTNKIRGTLCMDCNKGLGMFYDNPRLLEKAIQYLIRGRSEPTHGADKI